MSATMAEMKPAGIRMAPADTISPYLNQREGVFISLGTG
jgi:hypothetical protein